MGKKHDISDGLNQEFYQISADILGSFNKYRPPLNIYMFKEDVARIAPYYKVGGRLSNEQVEELKTLVKQGLIFVSRDDHAVYVKHISYQLDLVLVDGNLIEKEIADIFAQALTRRIADFFEQPVKAAYERILVDVMVLTEYLYADMSRTRALTRRMHKEHTLENHSVNTAFIGAAIWAKLKGDDFQSAVKRKVFDRTIIGLFLHDMGMAKVPEFIRSKPKSLSLDERGKVNAHVKVGFEMLHKLGVRDSEIEQCVTQHHERVGGSGYPLKTSEQDFAGRLCAVADSFAAMVSKRPYAEPMEFMKAAASLAGDAAYDSELTKALQLFLLLDLKLKP